MNWARGLFRLWLLFAVAAFGLTIAAWYDTIVREFKQQAELARYANSEVLLPIQCQGVRGVEPTDWFKDTKGDFGLKDGCWMASERFRIHYPEYANVNVRKLSDDMYLKAGFELPPRPNPWGSVALALLYGVGVPGLVLGVGAALYWAFAGFKRAAS